MKLITEDMSIKEIVDNWPQTSKVFIENGFFCVGCAASSIESVKQGILGHGISEKRFDEILQRLNEVAAEKIKFETKEFDITEKAIEKLIEIKANDLNFKEKKYLRISAKGEEEYDFEFVEQKKNEDIIFYKGNLKVILDKKSLENLNDIVINFVKKDNIEGFVFENIK